MITEDDLRRIIREELSELVALIQKMSVQAPTEPPPIMNDFRRAEMAALAARDKSRAKKALKGWDYSKA